MRHHRIEKFIPFWGEELTARTTPLETGKMSKVRLDKPVNFVGKAAIQEQLARGITQKLVQFQCTSFQVEKDMYPWRGEAVYRNGDYVGVITNSAYGFTLGKMICLGMIQHPDTVKGIRDTILEESWLEDETAKWEINIAGKMVIII